MTAVTTPLIGRTGNQLFQYCHARAYAEQNGLELRLPPWIGEDVFDIPITPRPDGTEEVLGGYRQDQDSLIYTRKQVRSWLRLKPEVEARLTRCTYPAGHLRRGDYGALGYVVVSTASYYKAAHANSHPDPALICENCGNWWLQDFYTFMTAPVLYRANSSFSWWAATLADPSQKIYSPVIDGIAGGETEQHCEFVAGNWPKLSNLPNITDLHLPEE